MMKSIIFLFFYGWIQTEEKIFWKNLPWLISDLIFDQYIQIRQKALKVPEE